MEAGIDALRSGKVIGEPSVMIARKDHSRERDRLTTGSIAMEGVEPGSLPVSPRVADTWP